MTVNIELEKTENITNSSHSSMLVKRVEERKADPRKTWTQIPIYSIMTPVRHLIAWRSEQRSLRNNVLKVPTQRGSGGASL